jgi:hypothetical protein
MPCPSTRLRAEDESALFLAVYLLHFKFYRGSFPLKCKKPGGRPGFLHFAKESPDGLVSYLKNRRMSIRRKETISRLAGTQKSM